MVRHNTEIHASNIQYLKKQTWTITDVIEENFAKLKINNKGCEIRNSKGSLKAHQS